MGSGICLSSILLLAWFAICIRSSPVRNGVMVVYPYFEDKEEYGPGDFDIILTSLLPKLSILSKINLDNIHIPVSGSTNTFGKSKDSLNTTVETRDGVINFAEECIHPMEVRIVKLANRQPILSVPVVVENATYKGNYKAEGTFLGKTVSYKADGKFVMKVHFMCETSIPTIIGKNESFLLREKGARGVCIAYPTEEATFTDILKNATPELSAGFKQELGKFIGLEMVKRLINQLSIHTEMQKAVLPLIHKSVRETLKEISFTDALKNRKPRLRDIYTFTERQ